MLFYVEKTKVSYDVFMLVLLAYEVHMKYQEPRTDWSIQLAMH